jgi:hypothetical protein
MASAGGRARASTRLGGGAAIGLALSFTGLACFRTSMNEQRAATTVGTGGEGAIGTTAGVTSPAGMTGITGGSTGSIGGTGGGGTTVTSGGTTGSIGGATSSPGGTTGAGGTTTAGGTTAIGSGGSSGDGGGQRIDGGVSCTDLESQYLAAMPAALSCDVNASGQCQQSALSGLSQCLGGCSVFVNDARTLNAIEGSYLQAGCAFSVVGCPSLFCRAPGIGGCVEADGGGGICQPVDVTSP